MHETVIQGIIQEWPHKAGGCLNKVTLSVSFITSILKQCSLIQGECKSNRPTAKSPSSISPPHLSKSPTYKITLTLIKIMKKLI